MDGSRTHRAAACAVAGAVAIALSIWLEARDGGAAVSGTRLLLAVALVAATSFLRVRLRFAEREVAVDLTEAAIVVTVFGVPPAYVAGAVALGVVGGELLRREFSPLVVARWTLGGAGAAAAYAVMHVGWNFTARNVAALVAAMVVVGVVSVAADLVAGRRDPLLVAAEWAVSVPIGILFAGAYATSTALVPLFVVPVALLHYAARGLAREAAHRERLEALHRVTRVLAEPVDPAEALTPFLDALATGFRADGAALTVEGRAAMRVGADGGAHVLRAPLAAGNGGEGELSVSRTKAAEPFTSEDAAVLEAVARELAAAVEKSGLLSTILDERRKLKQIVGSTSDGIFTLDAAGAVTSWNAAMESITGHSAETMIGGPNLALLEARDARGGPVRLGDWHEKDLPAELQVLDRDGASRWLDCSYSRAGRESLIVVARDRTAVHELERLKQDFVSIVSHELRTPITPIMGFTRSLLRQDADMAPEQRKRALESILRQAHRLERLIMNLLELSRLERGATAAELQTVDVAAVCRSVIADLLVAHPGAAVELQEAGTSPLTATAHELWVDQVISNLVTNALKYGDPNAPVLVRVEGTSEAVRVAVIDRGEGISPEECERIFGRFERLHQHDTQAGTGLGLYIARQLAEAMGGTLGVTSVVGEGSTFELTLAPATGQPERSVVAAGNELG